MSEQPPQIPPPLELAYETPAPSGNAQLLVRLAGIFLIISGGLDVLYLMVGIVSQGIRLVALSAPPPAGPPPAMRWIMIAIPFVEMFLSVVVTGLKGFGALQLLKRGGHAWGWGLAAGIASCGQFWSCPCCLVSLAAGGFTIVILCLPHVKSYLAAGARSE